MSEQATPAPAARPIAKPWKQRALELRRVAAIQLRLLGGEIDDFSHQLADLRANMVVGKRLDLEAHGTMLVEKCWLRPEPSPPPPERVATRSSSGEVGRTSAIRWSNSSAVTPPCVDVMSRLLVIPVRRARPARPHRGDRRVTGASYPLDPPRNNAPRLRFKLRRASAAGRVLLTMRRSMSGSDSTRVSCMRPRASAMGWCFATPLQWERIAAVGSL